MNRIRPAGTASRAAQKGSMPDHMARVAAETYTAGRQSSKTQAVDKKQQSPDMKHEAQVRVRVPGRSRIGVGCTGQGAPGGYAMSR